MAPVGCVRCSSWWKIFLGILWMNGVYSQSPYDIRLEDGLGYNGGRVEVFYNDQWNRICGDYFGLEEAQVVCRQLGYGTDDVVVGVGNYYSVGTGRFLEMDCYDGYDLGSCYFTDITYPYSCVIDAGVECATTTLDSFDYYGGIYNVRLVNGSSSREGRVEIDYNGQWNTICDDNWGLDEALVVCRQLGYDTVNVVVRSSAYYGRGSGPIRQVECFGWENTLDSCTVTSGDDQCRHYEDAGVKCGSNLPATTTLDSFDYYHDYGGIYNIRLVNGSSSREGRVEIYYNGQWNTICDDNWGLDEAQVVCRQLGYDTVNVVVRSSAYYGRGSGPIRQVECFGWENTLDSCYVTSGDDQCRHYDDAGVKCGKLTGYITPTAPPPGTLPRVIGAMSFVGVSLFLLSIVTAVGVLFVCRQQKPASPPVGMQEWSTVTPSAPTTYMTTPVRPDVPV